MKKLVLMFVAVAAISFASCGNSVKSGANADSTAGTAPVVESAADSTADSTATDSAAAPADSAAAPADSAK